MFVADFPVLRKIYRQRDFGGGESHVVELQDVFSVLHNPCRQSL